MRLMYAVMTNLYRSLDNDIYTKIPEGFKVLEVHSSKFHNIYSIKLQQFLYGLKQSWRMQYNYLSEYLLKEGYVNNPIYPCIFIRKSEIGFFICRSICWWFELYRISWRAHKDCLLFEKVVWNERYWKNKFLFWSKYWALSRRIFLHKKCTPKESWSGFIWIKLIH